MGRRRGPGALLRRRVLTHEGEFSALSGGEAARRIRDGLSLFYGQGWRADGFVPPGWVTNEAGRRAIREAGFAYRTDATALYRLPDERRLPLPTVVMSSRSPGAAGCSGPLINSVCGATNGRR